MLEIKPMDNEGYNRVITHDTWVVANLSFNKDTTIQSINYFQKHLKTDETFILLKGKCCLMVVRDENRVMDSIEFINMQPNMAYNIKKGFYHQHVLSQDGNVCIVENENTCDDNSPLYYLNEEEIKRFRKLAMERADV